MNGTMAGEATTPGGMINNVGTEAVVDPTAGGRERIKAI